MRNIMVFLSIFRRIPGKYPELYHGHHISNPFIIVLSHAGVSNLWM
jgi:hypothetical protein